MRQRQTAKVCGWVPELSVFLETLSQARAVDIWVQSKDVERYIFLKYITHYARVHDSLLSEMRDNSNYAHELQVVEDHLNRKHSFWSNMSCCNLLTRRLKEGQLKTHENSLILIHYDTLLHQHGKQTCWRKPHFFSARVVSCHSEGANCVWLIWLITADLIYGKQDETRWNKVLHLMPCNVPWRCCWFACSKDLPWHI